MAVYITGDCHGDYTKLSYKNWPESKNLTKDDILLVTGDFGIWAPDHTERWWFRWLEEKPYTIAFVDGNHENFDRLNSDEFEIVDFHGGKAHQICKNVFHLMRGYVFDFDGKKWFAFGGASSHDIDDGIVDENDFESVHEFLDTIHEKKWRHEMFRINHVSWWKEEMPDEEEMQRGIASLDSCGWKVDYVISHCAPQSVAAFFSMGLYKADKLTEYLHKIAMKLDFEHWYFGHYHEDRQIMSKYDMLYYDIQKVV